MQPWLLDSQTGRQPAAGLKQLHTSACILALHQLNPAQETVHVSSEHIQKIADLVKYDTCNCNVSCQGKGSANNDTETMLNPNALALASLTVRPCNPGINDQP